MVKKILLIVAIFYTSLIQAEENLPEWQKSLFNLNYQERRCLEFFFRTMLVNSEGGFVLMGSKPVCSEGIHLFETTSTRQIGTKPHQRSVNLFAGYQVWKKYFEGIPSKKLIICCKDHPDKLYNWVHLLWINPEKLLDVIQLNLSLFQYALGPQVTPESFLEYLINPTYNIPSDYTLTGIILGFGSQNALYYRRLELIQKQNFSRETPPLNLKNQRVKFPNMGYLGFDTVEAFETEPSFNYLTLCEEYQNLVQIRNSSAKISPYSYFKIPLFAVYKNDRETQDILANYQKNKKKIEDLLSKIDFLEQVLITIFE